ncbi:MAG: N-acyl-D-glucosamine 2-epimerase, partial [Chloroflexota bacterium]
YLSAVYQSLLILNQPLDLYFKPYANGFKRNILRVSPDILPPGSITIQQVWINDQNHSDFDAEALTVKLPRTNDRVRVKVRVVPTGKGARA